MDPHLRSQAHSEDNLLACISEFANRFAVSFEQTREFHSSITWLAIITLWLFVHAVDVCAIVLREKKRVPRDTVRAVEVQASVSIDVPEGENDGAPGAAAADETLAGVSARLKAQEGKKSLKIDRSKPHDPNARPEPLAEAPKSKACIVL